MTGGQNEPSAPLDEPAAVQSAHSWTGVVSAEEVAGERAGESSTAGGLFWSPEDRAELAWLVQDDSSPPATASLSLGGRAHPRRSTALREPIA